MGLLVTERQVVVPGEVLAEGIDFLPSNGTYRHQDKILADQLGLLVIDGKVLKTIPLSGRYLPTRNDIIIGRVIDITMMGWRFELNSPYTALLSMKEGSFDFIPKTANLQKYYALDDHAVLQIIKVTSQNLVDLTAKGPGLRKLKGGQIIKVNTHKVPRIIGKNGSMVSMLKKATGCKIIVGQNGLVWVSGEPQAEILTVNTLHKIENESHLPGLTEKIKKYLEEILGKKIEDGSEEHGDE
ncbi:MAG: exosome complex RNA-binding protein Rrp4 [Nanoarchaeota archaeon]